MEIPVKDKTLINFFPFYWLFEGTDKFLLRVYKVKISDGKVLKKIKINKMRKKRMGEYHRNRFISKCPKSRKKLKKKKEIVTNKK